MTRRDLPQPASRGTDLPAETARIRALQQDLGASIDGEVRFDDGTRAAYSTDASNFRQVPIGVVLPQSVEDGARALAVCRRHGAPILSRGGGTSLAGQCTNAAVVLDWTKYCHQLLSVDAAARRCVVEPGIVLDELNRQLAPYGLRYGPEPATHPNCTLGGMIGNNSCGATAQYTGKVVDNVARLEVLLYDGTRFWCGPTDDDEYEGILADGGRRAEIYEQLRRLSERHRDEVRRRYPHIPRRVSGYNLDSLLPEGGFDVAKLLVGSESTLVTVLHAELALVPLINSRSLVVLGYPSIDRAADAVPAVVAHAPIAVEGVDDRLVRDQRLKHLSPKALDQLPAGGAWLMVQFGGDSIEEADANAHRLLEALRETEHDPNVGFFDDPAREAELWQVREAGLGATAHVPGRRDTWEGWEDSAVPPDRLGDYLRELSALFDEFGYSEDSAPALYGHFGQGCVHTRIPFDLYSDDGVTTYRRFLQRAADLVVSYGGSLSGEHGDGQTRGELLPRMFGDQIVGAFQQLKAIFDPDNRMNPGKVVDPLPPDEHLRLGGDWAPVDLGPTHFAFPDDGGSFAQAANRCVGVGKCRQHSSEQSVMCPSYQVTLEEEHSTRGRARLLFEMLGGHRDGSLRNGWRSKAVHDALDLCLACKGCKTDCPVNVDMATYKAEFLSHYWSGRLRPRSDYSLGWLPAFTAVTAWLRAAPAFNAIAQRPTLHRMATALAGIERRPLPTLARHSLQHWATRRDPSTSGRLGRVLLWPDTFTNRFHPHVGQAAVEVLEAAGWDVAVPEGWLCCGLTWISTGQLAMAKRVLRHSIERIAEHVRAGGLVIGLEPSCTAVFRSDAAELLPDHPDVERVGAQTLTLAELLTERTPGWTPPRLRGGPHDALVQLHCHQHAVLGWEADMQLLDTIGVQPERLDSGCCGLAGNFGYQPGHAEVSEACAERVLLPRLRDAQPTAAILADGFSCRTQIEQLDGGGRRALHLAEVLGAAVAGRMPRPGERPEESLVLQPGGRGAAAA